MTQLAKQEQKEEGIAVPIVDEQTFQLNKIFTPKEIEAIRQNLDVLSDLIKAFEGKSINPDSDRINRLVNTKNPEERSFLPTLPLVHFQTYMRLIYEMHFSEAVPCKVWADKQAQALIGYKGVGGERYVEMMKAELGMIPPPASTQISFQGQQGQQQQKRGLLSRKPKPEKSEFENE